MSEAIAEHADELARIAVVWLHEREAASEFRVRATFWIGLAILVLTIVAVLFSLGMVGFK